MKKVMAAKKAAAKMAKRSAAAQSKMQGMAAKGQAMAAQAQGAIGSAKAQGQALAAQAQGAVAKIHVPADVPPRVNAAPAPALAQPVIKSEPTVSMSAIPMQQTAAAVDPKMAAAIQKFKNGKIEMEIGYPQVGLTIVLGIFYIAITALGIQTYNKCEAIQDSQKFKNLKMFLSHTMAVAITIPAVLLVTKFAKNEGGIFTLMYAIMGITGSGIALDIMRQPDCKDAVKKDEKNFAIASLVLFILLFLTGGYFTMKKYPGIGQTAKAAGAAAVAGIKRA
uniref:DUF5904 domain-containing protein n=1 Tax=Bathycoccus sp. RCC716 virus 2 TaxID=2530039 RepID=A0A7S6NYL9_9PHYC|nr:hypothetical protein [Bathycoccus sp. RCC716 virus 2]|tara:strand:- start:90 stop:926 length:837 start_codon:yes stop_codon:yes gene_type:complete